MKLTSLFVLAVPILGASGCQRVVAAAAEKKDLPRQNIQLSIYQGFASVHETRPVSLTAGANTIGVPQISKQLDQSSVIFDWQAPSQASVVASTYDIGVAEGSALLKQYVGKTVDLVRFGQNGTETERIHARLQVADPDRTVLYADGKYLINPVGRIEAPADEGIVTIPQLTVQVQSPSTNDSLLNVNYLTRGLSWSADYVATLLPERDSMNLECWASVTNDSGIDYPNAQLTFISGSPNEAVMHRVPSAVAGGYSADTDDAKAPVYRERSEPQAQTVGELYAYKAEAPATLSQGQMSRVKMLSSETVQITKDYSVRLPGSDPYYYSGGTPSARQNAVLAIKFKNAKISGLGMPLPRGAVRVFEPDASGTRQYIGAAGLGDTPTDTVADLALSQVFDIWAQTTMTGNKRLDKHTQLRSFSVLLHNSKAQPVSLRVVQDQSGHWNMEGESIKSTKPSSEMSQWLVAVPAAGEVTLKFVVKVTN